MLLLACPEPHLVHLLVQVFQGAVDALVGLVEAVIRLGVGRLGFELALDADDGLERLKVGVQPQADRGGERCAYRPRLLWLRYRLDATAGEEAAADE